MRRRFIVNAGEPIITGVAAHIGSYADAVVVPAGVEQVFVSGTPGLRPDGTRPDDFTDEAFQAWHNVEEALKQAGVGIENIVSVRQWLTSPDYVKDYIAVRKQVIHHQPAFMLGVIPGLVWPNLRLEIEVTAIKP
jgi:2-iminobutanoate/2-iminopropanoate deaminase